MPQTYPSPHGQDEPRSARRPASSRLGVERDDADTAQVGQLLRGLPVLGHFLYCGAMSVVSCIDANFPLGSNFAFEIAEPIMQVPAALTGTAVRPA